MLCAAGEHGQLTTPSKAKCGGNNGTVIVDTFKVRSPLLIESMMEKGHRKPGAGYISFEWNRTTVALLPPFTFSFHTKRGDDTGTVMKVIGHVATLVDGQGRRTGKHSPHVSFDENYDYSTNVKHAYKVHIALGLHRYSIANPGVVPAGLVLWLGPLVSDYV